MTFSERFNEWLIEHGEEPVSPDLAAVMDKAALATSEAMQDPRVQHAFQQGCVDLVRDAVQGKETDPAEKAREIWDRLEAPQGWDPSIKNSPPSPDCESG